MQTVTKIKKLPIFSNLPSLDASGFPMLLTPKETSLYLRIPLPTVYYLIKQQRLPAYQVGGRWRVKRDLLDRTLSKKVERDRPSALVLTDDPNTQQFYRECLKAAHYERVFVGTGEEAVTCADRQQFNLLIIDSMDLDFPLDEIVKSILQCTPNISFMFISRQSQLDHLRDALSVTPIFVAFHPVRSDALSKLLGQLKS